MVGQRERLTVTVAPSPAFESTSMVPPTAPTNAASASQPLPTAAPITLGREAVLEEVRQGLLREAGPRVRHDDAGRCRRRSAWS